MSEYIRRSDALAQAAFVHGRWDDTYVSSEKLKAIPAADVAPVTRCKDCKHKGWAQEPCHGKSIDYCKVWDCTLQNLESTFCSYGEPKEVR